MQLVSKNGGLVKKSGSLGTADNAVNFCCCGNCPTCPHLCGYYIEARAGVFAAYPLDPVAPTRVEDNIPFCASGDFLDYDQSGQGAETEGTPGLPSKCGFDTSNVNYSASGVTHQFYMVAQIGAKLAELDQAAPAGSASLNLQCLNGLWTATVEWGVSRIVNNSPVYCSARKTFPIRTGCTADPKICDLPDSEGSNILGRVFTVTGDSVTVSGLGTIPFRDSDRMGNCDNDECMAAWRSLWQAEFEVKRVPCAPGGCSGPCDEANPCPEGCVCCEGECVPENEIPEGSCCGPCDEASPCDEGCECVDGTCVPLPGCCCVGGQLIPGSTQEDCEACETVNTCYEYTWVEEGQECPEGFTPDGWGGCSRTTSPASCSQCPGYCASTVTGLCGTFYPDCDQAVGSYLEVDFQGFSCGVLHFHGPDGIVVTNGQSWFDAADWPNLTPIGAATAVQSIGRWENIGECEAYLAEYLQNPVEVNDTAYPGSPCQAPWFRCLTDCVDDNPLP